MGAIIVLADDEPDLRSIYAACLRNEGYEVWEAADSPQIPACRDVVMIAAKLTEGVRTESERRAKGELIRRQRCSIEGSAEAAIYEHPVARPDAPKLVRGAGELRQRCGVGQDLIAHDDVRAIEDV